MARSKRTLAKTDANTQVAPASKRVSTAEAQSKENNAPKPTANDNEPAVSTSKEAPGPEEKLLPSSKEAKALGDVDGKTWICLCHVRSNRCGMNKNCMCGRYADANPEENWIVTMRGCELYKEWADEQYLRDQGSFKMHIFEDWSGYGTCEVMENMIRSFVTR